MKKLLVLGAGTAGTMIANKLRKPSRRGLGDHRRRPRRRAPLPAGLPVPAVRDVRPATRSCAAAARTSCRDGVDLVLGEVDRVDAGRATTVHARPTGGPSTTTTSSSPPAPRRGRTRRRACSAPSGGAASSTSTPSTAPRRSPQALAGLRPRTARRPHHRDADQVPGRAAGVHLPRRRLAARARAARPGRARLRHAARRAPSPSRSPPQHLGGMLDERKIVVETDFLVERIDDERKCLVSYDEREVPFDLLVTVPLNMGADFVARSGLGDELNYVPVDKHTLLSPRRTTTSSRSATPPTSRPPRPARWRTSRSRSSSTTSSQHIAGQPDDRLLRRARQLLRRVRRRQGAADRLQLRHRAAHRAPTRCPSSARSACCKETRANHLGKLAFRWIYWNVLLPGRPLPLPAHMSMAGKHRSTPPDPRRSDAMTTTTHRRPRVPRRRRRLPDRPRRVERGARARPWPPRSAST